MRIDFYKYHGAGNDFIIIDNRSQTVNVQTNDIAKMCNRRFGIGADGLMLLEEAENVDFSMRYFNSDGKESTMCGNGGRCIVAFAKSQGIIKDETTFSAHDGLHKAKVREDHAISLQMSDVSHFKKIGPDYFLDTGSPHYVRFVDDISKAQVYDEGRRIRFDKSIAEKGTNVDFVQIDKTDRISIRTYERGVENETFACGTGAVASALATFLKTQPDKTSFHVHVIGGKLKVDFDHRDEKEFQDIWLTGPAEFVYQGVIKI